jgi:hypothetical protein
VTGGTMSGCHQRVRLAGAAGRQILLSEATTPWSPGLRAALRISATTFKDPPARRVFNSPTRPTARFPALRSLDARPQPPAQLGRFVAESGRWPRSTRPRAPSRH